MATLLDGWACGKNDIYNFFEENKIDISGCDNFDFNKRMEKAKPKQGKQQAVVKKVSIPVKPKKPQPVIIQAEKDYTCHLVHTVQEGNLKKEEDGKYASKNCYLHGKSCQTCKIKFVEKKESIDEYKVSSKTPCYACSNQACTYYLCGTCHTNEMMTEIEDDGNGNRRSSRH